LTISPKRKPTNRHKPIPGVLNFPKEQATSFFSAVVTAGLYFSARGVVTVRPERKISNAAKLG
jgi:hypothetical protein